MVAINVLGALVQEAPLKEITLGARNYHTDDLAITVLNLICLEQQLNDIKIK